jgi:hypothetical protein
MGLVTLQLPLFAARFFRFDVFLPIGPNFR